MNKKMYACTVIPVEADVQVTLNYEKNSISFIGTKEDLLKATADDGVLIQKIKIMHDSLQ